VSTRITNKKIEQGINKSKISFVPNSPHVRSIKPQEYNGNLNCILIAQLHDCVDFIKILEIVKITHEVIPTIRLKIIGDGKERVAFERLVSEYRLQDCIIFKGAISHEMVLAELKDALLGFALYTNKASWNRFGDSMKAREYLSFGLPVIINTIPSTADEIREADAGLVVEDIDAQQIASFIINIVRNKTQYMNLRQNAYHLAEKNSKELLLSSLLKDI
jgi:glycosyltransferase involved in cell wall biosynthesis